MNLTNGNVVRSRVPELIAQEEAKIMFTDRAPSKTVAERIAKFCEITPQTITLIKLGRATGCIYTALKLAEYFKCTVEELFYIEKGEN